MDGRVLELILRKRWEDVDSIHLTQVNGRWMALCRRWWTSVFCEQRVVCVCVCVCVSYLSFSRRTILPVVSILFRVFIPRFVFFFLATFSLFVLCFLYPSWPFTVPARNHLGLFILHLRYSSRFSAAGNPHGRKRGTLTEIYCHTPDCLLTPRILGVGGCGGLFLAIRRMRHS